MIIRRGETADEASLQVLLEAAFLDYVRGIGRDWPGPYEWLPERLAKGEVEVAEASGTLLGMAALTPNRAEATLTVDLLAVAPSAQGCGVGRLLLSRAEARAREMGANSILLHTVARYERLVRLYERAGFEVTHHGPRPKGDDGHPRAFMRKRLKDEDMTT